MVWPWAAGPLHLPASKPEEDPKLGNPRYIGSNLTMLDCRRICRLGEINWEKLLIQFHCHPWPLNPVDQ